MRMEEDEGSSLSSIFEQFDSTPRSYHVLERSRIAHDYRPSYHAMHKCGHSRWRTLFGYLLSQIAEKDAITGC
jgi:hypothetical protein